MKKILLASIIIIIIIISFYILLFRFSYSYDNDWYKGKIRQNIYVMYTDETYESVRQNNIFNIYHNDKEIIKIQYRLQGYQNKNNIKININDFSIIFNVYNEKDELVNNFIIKSNNSNKININSDWTDIIINHFNPSDLINYKYGAGQYKIITSPYGIIKIYDENKIIDTEISEEMIFYLYSDGEGKINLSFIPAV